MQHILLDWLHSQGTHLPVIVFTDHGDVSIAVNALKGGAFHFMEKPASCQQLVHCIQDAFALDRDLRTKASKQVAIEARLAQLTPREHEVLERVIEGVPNKCIAMEFGITERTVEKHRESIMEKMRVLSEIRHFSPPPNRAKLVFAGYHPVQPWSVVVYT